MKLVLNQNVCLTFMVHMLCNNLHDKHGTAVGKLACINRALHIPCQVTKVDEPMISSQGYVRNRKCVFRQCVYKYTLTVTVFVCDQLNLGPIGATYSFKSFLIFLNF